VTDFVAQQEEHGGWLTPPHVLGELCRLRT
jgi:hypothetical protein